MPRSSREPRAAATAISVCVPATRPDTIGATIQAVRRQTFAEWELLVLGQGASAPMEAAVARAAEGDARIRHVHLEGRGLSLARNAALEHASGEVLAFTDDDCEPGETWLASIAQAFRDDPALGLVGGAVVTPEALGWLATCPTITPSEAVYDPAAAPRRPPAGWDWIGANFAIRRDVTLRLGRFDECLGAGADFPAAEDTDYKLRLEAAGVRMLTTPRVSVVHAHGVRRGWRAMLNSQRNYASGNGGMAGKLTLLGDPRGEEWLEDTRKQCRSELGRPDRAFRALRRLRYFTAAYRRCIAGYRIDGACLSRL